MLFIWRGSVLPRIMPQLGLIFVCSALVVYFRGHLFSVKIPLNPTPFTLFGIALAIFLGFRNSAGYDRFWEGRKLWGALVNDARSLARQALTLTTLPADSPQTRVFLRQVVALAFCLKHQLRQTDASDDLHRLLGPAIAADLAGRRFKPVYLLRLLGEWVQQRRSRGELDAIAATSFDHTLSRLSDEIGGCERIAGTPIPYAYTVLLHRTIYLYCFWLPFGIVDNIGWATPFFAVFISYAFIALDEVVNQIENPFGTEDHDLPLDFITRTLEASVLEMAGEADVELPPTDGYLLT